MASEVMLDVDDVRDVARARRAVAALVPDECPDVADIVRLTVSEVLTNAIVHGRPPVGLVARVKDDILRIEVADASPARGSPQEASATASSGRGLAIVNALAHRWGIEARGPGKAVWLEFRLTATRPTEGTVVQLLGVPVETYLRSQEHLESTVHELQILAASDRAAFGGLEESILVPLREAMEFFRAYRRQGRAEAQAAASAGRDCVDLAWRLAPDAARAASTWGAKVAELERLATSSVLLTPPPDPDVARLRQWLAEQIVSQLTSARPPKPFPVGPA